jgi:UDP-N-acetylmuramoylalanine--D-glutamate ligase
MKKKVVILGLGASGRSSALLLLKEGRTVLALDQKADELKSDPQIQPLFSKNFELQSDNAPVDWSEIDQLVISPGVPSNHPQAMLAKQRKIEVIGEIELAFRYLQNPCIGVTGTNGKTTVVMLVQHILQSANLPSVALGNIGTCLSAYALSPHPQDILVVELSSYQLETLRQKCLDAAAFLNLTPDHLDRYASLEEYAKAKCRIANCLKKNGELWVSSAVAKEYKAYLKNVLIFDRSSPWEEDAVATISPMRYIQLGVPERQNIQAAYPLCRFFGVTDAQFRRGLETFRKPKHRIEFVGEWNGISFYDDSKATNIDSVMHAVGLFEGPIVLLAGGVHKGASYRPWIEALHGKVTRIVAFGQAASMIEEDLKDLFAVDRVDTLKEAVVRAVEKSEPHTSILLSPGCSSFDQFRNYEHRGNEFKRFVEEKVWIERKRS